MWRLIRIGLLLALLLVAATFLIPQFGVACDPPCAPWMVDRQTLRSQIQLYSIQHDGQYPPAETFSVCLLFPTTKDHRISKIDTPTPFGPYLTSIPVDPYTGLSTIDVVEGSQGLGDLSHGWHFNRLTAEIDLDLLPTSETQYTDRN